jgi:hypothetical protein
MNKKKDNLMKPVRSHRRTIRHARVVRIGPLAIALALLAGLAPALGAQEILKPRACSNASLNGSYGSYRAGTAVYGPVASQGFVVFNGEGGYYLRLNISRGGEIFLGEEYEGGYTINADCTGDVDGHPIVVVDDGKGYILLSTFQGFAVYEVGTRIHNGRGNGGNGSQDDN